MLQRASVKRLQCFVCQETAALLRCSGQSVAQCKEAFARSTSPWLQLDGTSPLNNGAKRRHAQHPGAACVVSMQASTRAAKDQAKFKGLGPKNINSTEVAPATCYMFESLTQKPHFTSYFVLRSTLASFKKWE